ncbi:class I SAM-dependent methyltransferase [Chloroflexota bacterium]
MIRAVQLYTFMQYCSESPLEKEILECGAGGWPDFEPLFVRFYQEGYQVHGIEISAERLAFAQEYCANNNIPADLREADMQQLPYPDASLSFVFSYNAIFHMRKSEISASVAEIERVLKPGGLCFINFLSINDHRYGEGQEIAPGEFIQDEGGGQTVHTYYKDDEAEAHFTNFGILFKEKRTLWRTWNDSLIRQGYIDYISRKN